MRPPALFISLTLSFWLGIYALRSYVPAAVWNLADELPLALKPSLALGTHAVGVLGVFAVVKWRRRLLNPLALAFAATSFAGQVLRGNDAIGPWLALLGWILWLWFMAAFADEIAAQDAEPLMAAAVATACAFQIALQSAGHGLDLPGARGPVTVAVMAVLVLVFAASVLALQPPVLARAHASGAWLLVGPALFLEITLAANLGRLGELLRASVPVTALILQMTLLAAVIVAERFTSFVLRAALLAIALLATWFVTELRAAAVLAVLAAQLVIIAGLREAAERRIRRSAAAVFAISAVFFVALLFAFYNFYELPALWLVALAPLGVAAALGRRSGALPPSHTAVLFPLAAAIALLYFVPPPRARPDPDVKSIKVLSYNIHHGFNDAGVPGMSRIAQQIADLNPDLVALQEVGRGWDLVGGNDLVGYLQWRFPEHQILFMPTNGQLWGNAIMSRLPVLSAAGGVFTAAPRALKYGWVGATLNHADAPMSFYSVHLTADLEGAAGDPRTEQARELLQVIGASSPVVVAGDFNAHPEDDPVRLLRTVLTDLGASAGLTTANTWPAGWPNERIDYVFGKAVSVRGGVIPRTLASDHLPVVLDIAPRTR